MAGSLQQSDSPTLETLDSFLVPNTGQPTLDLDSSLTKSDYAKVVFHDVDDVYLTDADVFCRYTVTAGVVSAHGDRVGIYRVGWTSPHDYVLFEWAPVPQTRSSEQEWEMQVLFSAQHLPKDDGEFYQLCYVKVDGSVAGASTPFQFRRPTEDELCEMEDSEEDLVVVRSRTAVAEERIRQMTQRNEELVENHLVLEEKHLKLLELSESLSEQLHKKTQRIDELQSQLQTMLSKEDFETEVKAAKLESMSQLRDDIDALKMEKNKLEQKIMKNDQYIQELQDTIKVLTSDKDQIVGLLHEETRQKSLLHEERERLTTRLDDISHMLDAMTQSKDMAAVEVHTHLTEKEKLTSQIGNLKQELVTSEESQEALQEKIKVLVKQLNKQKQENESHMQQSETQLQEKEDERITLTLQCSTLEKQVQEYKERLVAAEAVSETLQKQVADLHNRLQMALVEYQQIYKENYRLQKKFQKVQQKKDKKQHSEGLSVENPEKELTEPLKTEETQEQKKGSRDRSQISTSSDVCRTQETADGHNRETGETSHEEISSSVVQDASDNYKKLYEIAQDKIKDMETQLRMVTLDQRTAKLQQFQELQQLKEEIRQMKSQSLENQSPATSQSQISEQGNSTAENLECMSNKSHASVDTSLTLPAKQDFSQKKSAEDRFNCFSGKGMKESNAEVETLDQLSKVRISEEPNYLYPYPPIPFLLPRPPVISVEPLGSGEGLPLHYPANAQSAIRPPWNAMYTAPSCHPYPGAVNVWTTNYSYPYPQTKVTRGNHIEHPVASTQALPNELDLQGRGQNTNFVELHTDICQYGRTPEEKVYPSQPSPKMKDTAFQGPAMKSGERSEIHPVACTHQNISHERIAPLSNIRANQEPSKTNTHQQSSASCHSYQKLGKNLDTEEFTNPGILDVTPSGTLPPPIEPEVLPQARLAAMSAVNRSTMAVKDKTSETQQCISQEAAMEQMSDSPQPDVHSKVSSEVAHESSQTEQYSTEHPKRLDCPFCPVTFPGDNITKMDIHLETHLDLCCPICFKLYPRSSQEEFEFHVQEHFFNEEMSHFEYIKPVNGRAPRRWDLEFD